MGSKDEFYASVTQACQTRNTLQSLLVRLPQAQAEDRLILENSITPALTSYKNQVKRLEEMHGAEKQSMTVREAGRREKELSILKTDLSLIENGMKTKQLQMHAIQSPQELLDLERLGDSVHSLLISTHATYDILRDDNRYLTQIKHRTDWEAVELTALTRRAQTLTDATSEKCMVYVIIALAVFLVLQLVLLLIVIASKNLGIGLNGQLLKRIKQDMDYFVRITTIAPGPNTVIMGRRTWESIPPKFRPLPDRRNIVLTQGEIGDPGVTICRTLHDALEAGENQVFIIGGSHVYQEALSPEFAPRCKHIYLTRIAVELPADVFLPAAGKHLYSPNLFGESFSLTHVSKSYCTEEGLPYDFTVYTNTCHPAAPPLFPFPPHEEFQYLSLIRSILSTEHPRSDRTKVGTLSLFGAQQRWDLASCFPLLTTKGVFWKGVVEELMWFVRGDTDAKRLSDKGVTIWDGNGSREFLDSRGLTNREVGDLGPVYGFQWRHFGAPYIDCHTDYTNQGVDQLKELIETIKTDPNSRRMVMTAWNPAALREMALPPCHILSQFYVSDGRLSCLMYQRSCDMGLGVPFNIASYSLLTCLIAQVCGLKPGEFIHTLGDAHVYLTHVEALNEQLRRMPHTFPVLKLNEEVREIERFTAADITLVGYNSHPRIKMEMAL